MTGSLLRVIRWQGMSLAFAFGLVCAGSAVAEDAARDRLEAVVELRAHVPPTARTASSLGTERSGSGVVIDDGGLVLTIGYLVLEAMAVELRTAEGRTVPAEIVGYDHDTGFGLLRATAPLGVRPMPLGRSAAVEERAPVLVAGSGGVEWIRGAFVVSRREFAGYWEYLLDDAIFTSPPHPRFAGAALVDADGRLVGIGSLIVGNARTGVPGNMFVPIDLLQPILADLLDAGRTSGPPRPWLGLQAQEREGMVVVTQVSADAPAARAGLRPGDIIVGVAGEPVQGLADLYRKIWSQGDAGATVPLDVVQGQNFRELPVESIDRLSYLRLRPTY